MSPARNEPRQDPVLLTITSIAFMLGFAAIAALGHGLVIQALWRGRETGQKPRPDPTAWQPATCLN